MIESENSLKRRLRYGMKLSDYTKKNFVEVCRILN